MIGTLFTTRRGGVSVPPYDEFNLGGAVGDDPAAVRANRTVLAQRVGLPAGSFVWMDQVHGALVRTVGRSGDDPPGECDGIVTAVPGIALGVLAADCVPILARDERAGVIGAAHAGRRGAADGIAERLLEAMVQVGASVPDVVVQLGPAICGRCYEVPAGLRDEVERTLSGSAVLTARGTPGLDLRAGLRRQLLAAGVRAVRIDSRCTYEDPELFSHRRGAPTGRLAGVIWRTPAAS